MRNFLTLVVAVAILAGAYVMTYGLPFMASPMATDNITSAAAPRRAAGGSRGTTVVTAPLELRPYESVLNAIGTASALRSIEVVSDTAGEVIEANLGANRDVEAGEILVRFDDRIESLNLEIAQANLDQALETVSRYERLQAGGNSTVTDVTLSEARVSQRLAEAAFGLAQVALDDRTIRAPITGRLGLSDVEIGDILADDAVIASIDQSDVLIVEFELPESGIGLLEKDKSIIASTSTFTGKIFDGVIVSYDSRIDSVTRSVTVKAQIDNPDDLLWPGMTFSVRLTQKSEPLPSLPSTAITWSRAGSSVWADVDSIAEQVPVTILFRQGDTVWIDAEVAEGTMIVTEGAQKLRSGTRIVTPDMAKGNRPGPAAGEREADTLSEGQKSEEDAASVTSGQRAPRTPKEPT